MDTFLIALKTVFPLFLVIFTGYLFLKTGAAGTHWITPLNQYALRIGFPALVIVSLMEIRTDLNEFLPLIVSNSAYIVGSMLIVFPISWIFRLPVKLKQALFLILPFGNVAYLGIPVLENAYGREFLPLAAIISALYIFWMFTLGLALIEAYEYKGIFIGRIVLRLIKNPLLISVFIGVTIVSFKINVPDILEQTLRFFSESVTAVVLFSLGIFMGLQKIGNLREWTMVAIYSLTAMVVFPGIYCLLVSSSWVSPDEIKASILEAAMPLGLTPYALSVEYNLESPLFARCVVFATLISIIIIPLWIYILG